MSILSTWKAWSLQAAVFAGSATALVALLQHTPPWVACMRGAGAWLAIILLGKLFALALNKVEALSAESAKDMARKRAAEGEGSEA
ncbi:MAG: hypothetical protein KDB61_11795 [Planctomycetes bacterium]|nr:hypothetical protein [Planctomycetota bacterium]